MRSDERKGRGSAWWSRAGLAGAFIVVAAAELAAQQNGSLTGRVIDASTGQPVAAVQVHIPALRLGMETNGSGRYLLPNVPAGTHAVQAQRLGYRSGGQTVEVRAGETVEVNFALRQEAIALDEVVVTGTAGGSQRRAIGNVVETIDATSVLAVSAARSVQDVLAQRTPGLISLPMAGQVGTGAPLRVRGINSMSLANEPIVYIDGVRMDSDPRQGPSQRGGRWVNRLNDLSPEDIQSIEVIKGPSAATLYGTEASNGVIQIITKRGSTGAPQFDVTLRGGTNWFRNPEGRAGLRWYINPATGQPEGVNIYRHERLNGLGPIFTNGSEQGIAANVKGGTDAVRYFAALSWDDDTGVVSWNWDQRFNGRLNLDLVVNEQLSAGFSAGYLQRQVSLAQTGTGFYSDPFSNLIWGHPATLGGPQRGFFVAPPEEWSKVETRSDLDRITTSLALRHSPLSWFTQRLNAGVDVNEGKDWILWPRQPEGTAHFWGPYGLGRKETERATRRFFTLDYAGTASVDVARELVSRSSVGFQYYRRSSTSIAAVGSQFPALPVTTVSGGADRTGGEDYEENATVGVYFQQQADWRNRVFLTFGLRGDDNSAFGAEYDAAIYPKVSGAWVVHEEPFWNISWLDQLRVRGAWGAAGQQPGTFDAARLYDPNVGFENEASLLPGAFGNPQLKPERSEELEYGFDASLFDGRIDVVFSHYNRRIKDAIVQRPVPTSSGFSGAQIVNIGEVRAWGNEIGVTTRVLQGRRLGWDVDVQLATMRNRIEDLGDLAVIGAGGRNEHRAGYPIGAIFVRRILEADISSTGIVTRSVCDAGTGAHGADPGGAEVPCGTAPRLFHGPASPTWQIGVSSAVTLFDRLRLYGRVEGNGGHYQINTELRAIHNLGNSEVVLRRNDPMVQATRQFENDAMGLYDASFARLKELSATYTLPNRWIQRFGATNGSVTVAGRNLLMLWTGEHGFDTPRDGRVQPAIGGVWVWDPEIRSSAQTSTNLQTVMPPFTSASVTLRLSF